MSFDQADIELESDIDAEEHVGAPRIGVGAFASAWRVVRSLLAGRSLQLVLLIFAVLMDTALNISFPLIDRIVIDQGLIPRVWSIVAATIVYFALGSFILTLLGFGMDYLNAKLGTQLVARLRARLMDQLLVQPQAYFHNTEGGEALSRFSTDIAAAEEGLVWFIPLLLLPSLEVIYSAAVMFSFNFRLGLIGLLVFPLNYMGVRLFSRRAFHLGFEKRRNEARILSAVVEAIAAQPVIHAFGLYRRTRSRFSTLNRQWQQTAFQFDLSSAAIERASYAGVYLVHAAIFGIGAYWAFQGIISVGTFVAFEGLFLTMGDAVSHVSEAFGEIASAVGGLRHIAQFLDLPVVPEPDIQKTEPVPLRREITFENVQFSRPESNFVLGPLNVTFQSGHRTAIVGRSGAGKSTIVQLLLGLEQPTHGRILIDGCDVTTLPHGTLRRMISPVFQDNFIFHDTIAENIRLGGEGVSEAEISLAIKLAGLDNWVDGLPLGSKTKVGERGARMSGGQRQRLAIARALARQPRVLLLDEVTSNLDNITAEALRNTLATLHKRQTIINISHRLSMVCDYEQILVLERGQLVAKGRHANLLRRNNLYRVLWGKER
jgi:ATP-binding cassette, subfamily B, bacterial